MKWAYLLIPLLLIGACTPSPYRRYGTEGAQEFILDSYQICLGNFPSEKKAKAVTVLSEVGLAQTVPVPSGIISLREAIAVAGGIPETVDKRHIQVIRGSNENPKIYTLSWDHIVYLPNDSLLLLPGDTIYISEKPTAKWGRVLKKFNPLSQN